MKSYKEGGPISSDDPLAVEKLEKKLAGLMEEQDEMKKANSHYRKHKSMKGCTGLTDEDAEGLDRKIQGRHSWELQPYPVYLLQNNNANMRRIRERIKELKARDAMLSKDVKSDIDAGAGLPPGGWEFEGGSVALNAGLNRIQIFFDIKPDEEVRTGSKGGASSGLRAKALGKGSSARTGCMP